METIILKETDFLQMKQTIDFLQNEIVKLKEQYLFLIQYIIENKNVEKEISETLKKELEERLEKIENGQMKLYNWNDLKNKYGIAI